MNRTETVIVTGATGFIGRTLSVKLKEAGYQVIGLSSKDGDISDPSVLLPFDNQKVSHVFHLAGSTFVPASWEKPNEFIRSNVHGTSVVLDFCTRNKCRMTYVSAYIYGSNVINPISEETIPQPNNPYALSKKMAEELCAFYAEYFDLKVSIIRPFNVYGPGQNDNFLIPFIISQVKNSTEVRVKDLDPKRDYIHVDDVVGCIIKAMSFPGFGIFNAGTGRSYSVKEVIDLAMIIHGVQLPVISEQTTRLNEISDTIADIAKARDVIGWEPKISLADGLRTVF